MGQRQAKDGTWWETDAQGSPVGPVSASAPQALTMPLGRKPVDPLDTQAKQQEAILRQMRIDAAIREAAANPPVAAIDPRLASLDGPAYLNALDKPTAALV